jgi:hypothetical protein
MYLVLFLDQRNYKFNISLHSTFEAAEAAYEALLQRFILKPGAALPPKATWAELCDRDGENPHLYRIECDGELGEEIHLSDLAAA